MGKLISFPCLKEECEGYLCEEEQGSYKCNMCGATFDKTTYTQKLDNITSLETVLSDWLVETLMVSYKEFLHSLEKIWGGMEGQIKILSSSTRAGNILSADISSIINTSLLMPVLHTIYDPSAVEVSDANNSSPKDWTDSNLILLCGPIKNSVAETLMPQMFKNNQISYNFVNHTLINREGKEWSSDKEWDYGIAVKTENPLNLHKKLFLLAGCRSEGTNAATVGLMTRGATRSISECYGDNSFEILFRTGRPHNPASVTIQIEAPEALVNKLPQRDLVLTVEDVKIIQTALLYQNQKRR